MNLEELEQVEVFSTQTENRAIRSFKGMDVNGDGVIDRAEFVIVLQSVDPVFFTDGVINILLDEADADGDGVVHYAEFLTWLYEEDAIAVERIFASEDLHDGQRKVCTG